MLALLKKDSCFPVRPAALLFFFSISSLLFLKTSETDQSSGDTAPCTSGFDISGADNRHFILLHVLTLLVPILFWEPMGGPCAAVN